MAKRKRRTADGGGDKKPSTANTKSTSTAKRQRRARDTDDETYSRRSKKLGTQAERRVTRLMTTDASRRAVFETAELLENILLFLPNQDILTSAQRVCRQFNNVVKESNSLQEKLFFRQPKSPKVGNWAKINGIWQPVDEARPGSRRVLERVNELLIKTFTVYDQSNGMRGPNAKITDVFEQTARFHKAIRAWLRGQGGTWQQQYLIDDRIKKIRLSIVWKAAGHEGSAAFDVDLSSVQNQTVDAILSTALNTSHPHTVREQLSDTIWKAKVVTNTLQSIFADTERKTGKKVILEKDSISFSAPGFMILTADEQASLIEEAALDKIQREASK